MYEPKIEKIPDLLQHRASSPRLEKPGPDDDDLVAMTQIALRAPDHALLRPTRFVAMSKKALRELGEVFLEQAKADGLVDSEAKAEKFLNMPLRAPVVVAVISAHKPHAKVPEVEQVLSTGASTQLFQLAADALGFASMWRTGDMAYGDKVAAYLGLSDNEKIAGFLYLGTAQGSKNNSPEASVFDHLEIRE